jgi:4'-phosphopantetheinyl transferase
VSLPEESQYSLDLTVWCLYLDGKAPDKKWVNERLSEAELHRAAKFLNPLHSRRFAVCRATAKEILSSGLNPQKIQFHCGPYGKPSLPETPDIKFSIAHSGSMAAIAVISQNSCSEIGVDLEDLTSTDKDFLGISRYFHPSEQQLLRSIENKQVPEAFYRLWVRKEAVLKALGTGLSLGLDRLLASAEPAKCLTYVLGDNELIIDQWWTPTFIIDKYIIALSIHSNNVQIQLKFYDFF